MRFFERKPQFDDKYILEPGRTMESRHRMSLGGVRWDKAPLPPRAHRCWPQTKHIDRTQPASFRCACGAWSRDGKRWVNRNSRRPRPWWRKLLGRAT